MKFNSVNLTSVPLLYLSIFMNSNAIELFFTVKNPKRRKRTINVESNNVENSTLYFLIDNQIIFLEESLHSKTTLVCFS